MSQGRFRDMSGTCPIDVPRNVPSAAIRGLTHAEDGRRSRVDQRARLHEPALPGRRQVVRALPTCIVRTGLVQPSHGRGALPPMLQICGAALMSGNVATDPRLALRILDHLLSRDAPTESQRIALRLM